MSLKKLLGLEGTDITDVELMQKVVQCRLNNEKWCEFDIEGDRIKMHLPIVPFDPNEDDRDSW